jgi:hypothetical protein
MLIKRLVSCISITSLLILASSAAIAGGSSWLFHVQDYREEAAGRHIVILKPVEPGKDFPLNCNALTVHAQYSSVRWFFVSDTNISKENHLKALSLIKAAFATKAPIRFGSMGEGFGFDDGKSLCDVHSRALSVLEAGGQQEIYSYYKWP